MEDALSDECIYFRRGEGEFHAGHVITLRQVSKFIFGSVSDLLKRKRLPDDKKSDNPVLLVFVTPVTKS
jgi:hypothetical protein